ncbi:MAG: GNAT family N-acetyltransferase [Planctomycetota bacterium]
METTSIHRSSSSVQVQPARDEDWPEIRRLLHRTFVVELNQYQDDGSGFHQDKFEHKNRMFLAREGDRLVGMVAVHDQPPFSVAARLPQDLPMESLADRPLEVRLLCVIPGRRSSRLAFALMSAVYAFAHESGHRELWISGVRNQLPLYRRLGFEPLGPPVPGGAAEFTPMRVKLDALPPGLVQRATRSDPRHTREPLCLLPGPPRLHPQSTKAAASAALPLYHRSDAFLDIYREVQRQLSTWCGGHRIALIPGGGTLANDVVAQALRHLPDSATPGLLLCNGEFSDRLRDHALGAGLTHEALDFGWGRPWDMDRIRTRLVAARPGWIWAPHCESSTGHWNPVEDLVDLVEQNCPHAPPICLDAVSTLGITLLPDGISLASAVSGKTLQALPGIAIVASAPGLLEKCSADLPWPPSLDLPTHCQASVPPHTLGFPALASLDASLRVSCAKANAHVSLKQATDLGTWIRRQLRSLGIRVLAEEDAASPVITTFEVPAGLTTMEFLSLARSWGFQLAGRSSYLRGRRLAQIATFGSYRREELVPFFDSWRRWKTRAMGSSRL